MSHFGNEMKAWRARNGVSLRKLAEASGLSVTYIHGLETGKRRSSGLSIRTMHKIADAIGHKFGGSLHVAAWIDAEDESCSALEKP